jgi:hypothetical protein
MSKVALYLLLMSSLSAQTVLETRTSAINRLNATLLALQRPASSEAVNNQLVNDILSLAESGHKPARSTVIAFAHEVAASVEGRSLPSKALSRVTGAIFDVLQSAGEGTYKLQAALSDFQDGLVALGLSAQQSQVMAESLRSVGTEVRGPQDMPVLPARRLP